MKRFTFWKCAVPFATTMLIVQTEAASPAGPEYRVGGFVMGCQAYTFHRFTAFEAIDKTAASGGKTIEL